MKIAEMFLWKVHPLTLININKDKPSYDVTQYNDILDIMLSCHGFPMGYK